MSAELWWANILQGSLGAVIGLIGLFGVFWLTRQHELKRTARDRTEAGVVHIVEASHEMRLGRNTNRDELIDALAHSLVVFSVKEAADHPKAARWAFQQSRELLSFKKPEADIRAAPWQAGMISGKFMEWSRLGFPADFFRPNPDEDAKGSADRASHEKNVVEAAVEQLDREGVPASRANIARRIVANAAQRSPTSDGASKETEQTSPE